MACVGPHGHRKKNEKNRHICAGIIDKTPLTQSSRTDTGLALAAIITRVMILNDPFMVASLQILSSASNVRAVLCLAHSLAMNTNIPFFPTAAISVIKCISV